jgi:ATP-dependent RNA helicase RhlE
MKTSFAELELHPTLLTNLNTLGYEKPSAIQLQAIPFILEGNDVLGIAQTGTGKTAAFCLPILHKLVSSGEKLNTPRALILTPTRELCAQIHTSIEGYAAQTLVKSCAIYGGVGQGSQVRALKEGTSIVVATPGRLLDLLEQRLIRLVDLQFLVIDEADRMLDMGFIDDLKEILGRIPSKRQSLLFSATMPSEIEHLAAKILRSPEVVEVAPPSTVASNIDQRVIFCKRDHKFQLLKKIIKEEVTGLVLVFTKTKNSSDSVVEYLAQNRMASRAIHGDKDQGDRERSIRQFTEGSIKVLIATDLVSRGIDVDGISHVINFELPLDPEGYVHRIGRTARAGSSGSAISFCEENEKPLLAAIERLTGETLKTETFEGKSEALKLKTPASRKVTAPTPGKSQEKTAWLDHSKRQRLKDDGKKINVNPAFKKKKKKR